MLPEGTLLSGGEKDRKIIAWDSLQNYNKITETKVGSLLSDNKRRFYLQFILFYYNQQSQVIKVVYL